MQWDFDYDHCDQANLMEFEITVKGVALLEIVITGFVGDSETEQTYKEEVKHRCLFHYKIFVNS